MALQKQDVQVVMAQGEDTKTDPKLVDAGKFLVLENCFLDKKQGSFHKRYGNAEIPTDVINLGVSTSLSDIQEIATLGDELVAITKDGVYGYNEQLLGWYFKGAYSNVVLESDQVLRDARNVVQCDLALNSGVFVVASITTNSSTTSFTGPTGITIQTIDATTKKIIAQDFDDGLATRYVKCVSRGTDVYVYFIQLNDVRVVKISATGPSTIPASISAGVGLTARIFDACNYGSEIVLSTASTTGANFTVRTSYVKSNGAVGGIVDGLPADAFDVTSAAAPGTCDTLNVFCDTDLYLVYAGDNTGNDLSWNRRNSAFVSQATATLTGDATSQPRGAVACMFQGAYTVFYNLQDLSLTGIFPFRIRCRQVSAGGTVTTLLTTDQTNQAIYTKPFFDADGGLYLCVTNINLGSEQKSYFLMKLRTFSVSGRTSVTRLVPVSQGCVFEGISDGFNSEQYNGNIVEDADGYFYGAFQRAFAVTSFGSNITPQEAAHATVITKITIDDSDNVQTLESDNCLLITGGFLWCYDGHTSFEQGFLTYPKINSVAPSGAGNVADGTYLYISTYEWTDASGNKHYSTTSLPATEVISTGPDSVVVQSTNQTLTYRGYGIAETRPIGINVYRTQVNSSTPFYKTTNVNPEQENNVTTSFVTSVTDNTASYSSNELLYTTGGVIENAPTGSCTAIDAYQGRVWLAGKEFKKNVGYSKSKTQTVAYQFNPDFEFKIDTSEKITATATLDDKVLFFTQRRIFVQAGQGPSDTGQNSDFLENPQEISSDVGCLNSKTIVKFSGGVIFKSNKGFYLVDRGLNVSYIGKPVDRFNDLDCKKGVLIEDSHEIRWVHSNGVCIVYNYEDNQWSTHTNFESVSCCMWKGLFVMAKTDGSVWVEDRSTYLDAGAAYSRRIVTSWFAMAGLQHAQRLYRILILGELKSRHTLRAYIAYDYEPARREEFVFDSTTELGNVSMPDDAYYDVPVDYTNENRTYDIELRPSIQKCESFRLELYDENFEISSVPVDGECCVFTSITFTLGVKPSTLRPSSSRRAVPQ